MNRVSVRTLVLVVELFAVFAAYQCMAYLSPAETPTKAARPENTPNKPTDSNKPKEWSKGTAEAPGGLRGGAEDEPESLGNGWTRLYEEPADPNDCIEPEQEELTSQDVE